MLNALEFSPVGSEVDMVGESAGKGLVLRVLDRGPGMPEWALEKAWDRFWSTPRPGGGSKSSGLGLPFVREVARLHGGTAALEVRPDGGMTASLRFP